MDKTSLRYRQVHLDFHTSAACEDVGADFDPQAFANTVRLGHVDSVTIFAKCHHGFSYYPTKVGTMHPNLKCDLLGQQIEALHAANVRAPIYVSIMWDDLAGETHPEWIIARKDGTLVMRPPLSGQSPVAGGWGWTTHDVSSGYGDYVIAQVEELCRNYDVDGFFFDICFPVPNYSPWSQARMRAAGVRLDDDQAVYQYAADQLVAFFERMSTLVREHAPEATIFYNGTVSPQMGRILPSETHVEIESLPTSGHAWGYLHYPIMARQARTYGLDILGMTGRFHKSWADFGGLKTRDQLDYECGVIVGAGGKISVGDQLHPRGVLDPAVYRLLGHSFGRIEQLEPWLVDAKPAAEAAILSLGPATDSHGLPTRGHSADVEGAAQIFLECAVQFDILDPASADFSGYQLLVLPDGAVVDARLRAKIETFLQGGGKLVMSGTAGLDAGSGQFNLPDVPVTYAGLAPTTPAYLRLDDALAGDGELATDYDYVFYEQAHLAQPVEGATSHGELRRALFNRTWEHFTSHAHAPVGDSLNAPVAVERGPILYFAAPLFAAYRNHDYWVYREIVRNALRSFLPRPQVTATGPGWAEVTLHTQAATADRAERKIVHVVTYQPRRSLQAIPHVDQAGKTAGLSVKVRSDGSTPTSAYLAPERQPLTFTQEGDYTRVDLPPVGPHAVVVLE
jgi:hypothetical protein